MPTEKQRVILFDTEQSQYDVSRVVHRILLMAEINDPSYFVYSLRALSPGERLIIIEQKLNNTDDLGIIVIDGLSGSDK